MFFLQCASNIRHSNIDLEKDIKWHWFFKFNDDLKKINGTEELNKILTIHWSITKIVNQAKNNPIDVEIKDDQNS